MRIRIMISDCILGVFEVNKYNGTNDKHKKNIWTLYGSSWDHVIIKFRDKKSDKMSKNI